MRTARLLATAVLAATTLTACEGDGGPEPSPLPAQTATTTPAPPTPPQVSAGQDAKAAEALVRYYFEAITFASATGDTSQLVSLSTPQCDSCAALIENIQRTYGAGGRVESNGWSVRSIERAIEGPNHTFVFDLQVDLTEERVFKEGSETPEVHDATVRGMRLTSRFEKGAWAVQKLEITQ